MGSVKLKDLKAYVRYDGSGRVVSGSLVFRKKKPKNGRWVEIPKNLCCNGNPSSTTTTSTTTGGGSYPFELLVGQTVEDACAGFQGQVLWFASAPGQNQAAYLDAALTIPYAYAYINRFGDVYSTNAQGVMDFVNNCAFITTTSTTTQAQVFSVENQRWGNTQNDACTGVNPPTTFYTTGPLQFGAYLQDGNVIYLDQALTQPVQYPYIVSPGITRLLDCSNGVLSNQRNC